MANIPINQSALILIAGQSITGNFSGFTVTAAAEGSSTNQTAHFTVLKDGNGNSLISGSDLFIPAGAFVPLMVTSASLHSTSGAVIFYR